MIGALAARVYRLWFASGGEDAEDEGARRAANLETYGENIAMERAATNAFVNAWNSLFHDLRAIPLNDFTRADLVVELPDGGGFLPVQVKTTKGLLDSSGRLQWHFSKVSEYPRMVVLCWTPVGPRRTGWFSRWFGPRPCGWVYDGQWLATRPGRTRGGGTPKDLYITPGGRNERHALAVRRDVRALAREVHRLCGENRSWLPYPTLEHARNDLPAPQHQVEKKGLDAFMDLCAEDGLGCFFPPEQGSHTDLVVTLPPSGVPSWLVPWVPSWLARRWDRVQRVQAKTLACRHNKKYDSYFCSLCTSGGKEEGKMTFVPYPAKAFDVLVLVWFDSADSAHWWIIPERDLRDRGYVGNPGRKGITVHMTDEHGGKSFDEYYQDTTPDLAALFFDMA